MEQLYEALIGVGIVACGVLTTILGLVGANASAYLRARREVAVQQLKRQAADNAVAAVEEKARGSHSTTSSLDKLTEALQLADMTTPRSMSFTPDDIRAGVTRLRASLADPSLKPSSQPPPMLEEPETLPPPPRRMP